MLTTKIVPLTLDTAAAFRDLIDLVARERRYLSFTEAPSIEQTRDFIASGIASQSPQYLAVRSGEAVGWCDIRRLAMPSYAHRGTLGMGVHPDFRRQGFGTHLLDATLEAAWSSGFTRVELTVYDDNLAAVALYERLGFSREGLLRDAVQVDGRYRDAIAMAIIRRQPAAPSP